MPRDLELDRLKSEDRLLFQAKQAAWARWHDAQERANDAYDISQEAWNARVSAKETMNCEYNRIVESSDNYRDVWDEYGRIRDYNNSHIESLRSEADYEHQQMQECFEQASYAYESGDKASAPYYSQQGHEHKDRRNELNAEISALANEVKEARQNAERRAPKTDNSMFRNAKAEFDRAKAEHQAREAEFKRLKAERDRLRVEFDNLNKQHKQAKEAFKRRLDEIKSSNACTKQELVDKVNMALVRSNPHYLGTIFGKNAKFVPKNGDSGKIDVYFAGLAAAGDGTGHGHATIDEYGNVVYLRDAWTDHDSYLIDENADIKVRKYGKNAPTHKF